MVHYRADPETLHSIFVKHASIQRDGESFMTPKDFVVSFLQFVTEERANEAFVKCIARAVDTTKDGLISFEEFKAFEALLCTPDALYALAFEVFDQKSTGTISFDDFANIFRLTNPHSQLPFNFDCEFIKLYFGKSKDRSIGYKEFTQLIHDISDEHAVQAFKHFDLQQTGFITGLDFQRVMLLVKGHLLTGTMRDTILPAVLQEDHGRVSYAYYMGFINLLSNMELFKRIYLSRSQGDKDLRITREEFLDEAQKFAQITPMEVNILFHLASIIRPDGHVSYSEIESLAPIPDSHSWYHLKMPLQDNVQRRVDSRGRTIFLTAMEQIYRFTLGSVAGAVGATAVYPIDLVKTRMQNQRTGSAIGELLYKNSFDCFRKVVRFEGFTGLYRGLAPQLVGVAPEKAIKLTVNDFVRDQLTHQKTGHLPLWAEILSGGCAGASQVVFTNPLEIVKIRLQVAGEIASTKRISAFSVIKDLGFFGLYKGSRACFLRDIPFSALYFTLYSHLKSRFADHHGYISPGYLLLSATLSGAPAACLTTPADVIKTRLQVAARSGQTTYSGLTDAARKIWREEGGRAFWKGAGARVCRSSPQFGVTLLTYEMLQRFLYLDFGGAKINVEPPVSDIPRNPDHVGGYTLANGVLTALETKLGLCFSRTPSSV